MLSCTVHEIVKGHVYYIHKSKWEVIFIYKFTSFALFISDPTGLHLPKVHYAQSLTSALASAQPIRQVLCFEAERPEPNI